MVADIMNNIESSFDCIIAIPKLNLILKVPCENINVTMGNLVIKYVYGTLVH
jgi:hypothetical protein